MEIADLVLQYGIAAGIAVYLVWWVTSRLERSLDDLNSTIKELGDKIDRLTVVVERAGRG